MNIQNEYTKCRTYMGTDVMMEISYQMIAQLNIRLQICTCINEMKSA